MVALDLAANVKSSRVRLIAILLLMMSITFISLIPSAPNQTETEFTSLVQDDNSKVLTYLTSSISVGGPEEKLSHESSNLNPESVSPAAILRGRPFTMAGRLIDLDTLLGIPNEPIWIYWSYFTWTDLETDKINLDNNYKVGEGITNSNGNFSIVSVDNDHSKRTGFVTVYAVFPGDPLLGPIELNRQYSTNTIECYARVQLGMLTNSTIVREGNSFEVLAALLFDNSTVTVPQPVSAANGHDITFDWLGSLYNITIVGDIAATILNVPMGTTVGVYHPLEGSFNISTLGLTYTVGGIITEAELGTSAADWCNTTTNIFVFTGAGIVFDIDEPAAPGIGFNPEIVRGDTLITLSGVLSDSGGGPFGFGVNLTVFVEGTSTIGVTTENDGNFSVSFIINQSIPVGENSISVDVDTGQGITAITETENITVLGNSSILTPSVNGTSVAVENAHAMPNETLQITGIIRDAYSSVAIVGMGISAQWEDFGLIYITNTTAGGAFTIDMTVPLTVNPLLENGTVYLSSSSMQYYTSSNYSFVVDVFTEAQYTISLNTTTIADGSYKISIGGETIYINSNLTFSGFVTDQFGRPIESRTITLNMSVYSNMSNVFVISSSINGSGYFQMELNDSLGYINATRYSIVITFDDAPSYKFSFDIYFETLVESNGGSSQSPTTGAPFGMTIVYVLITVVSLIIIVSGVYAFGRFRRTKKGVLPGPDVEYMDLPTIMKQIEEADKAKDYRRAVVLCFKAFELMCINDLRILYAKEQSPRELARLVASTNRIPVRDVTMLVMRFEEARYSDHSITKNQFNHALQALDNVQLALKQEPKTS
ncbi:MAG: DUF4129 domain-containing protein [Candidatus Heimdallarchaeota archaeon]|nr:DUF4129 domain-containing protein [Candidatus Heimdallarchaeota archaeon]